LILLHLLRFTLRITAILLWVLVGFVILICFFMWTKIEHRDALNRWWSRWLLRWAGVSVQKRGEPVAQGGALLIANHVSWLDIFVLSSQRATIFVGKSEIRQWPVLGWLVAGVGTVFIERGNRKAVHKVGLQMKDRFDRGQLVGLFPEGTTSEGEDVLPFHAGLFEPALKSDMTIQPVALLYYHRGRRSPFASFVGTETLVENAWRVLGETGVSVEVVYLPVIHPRGGEGAAEYASRHRMSEAVRTMVQEAVVS
jgi:1-acyl-sn-glycerol-3-phosphate acyltransferase